MPKYNSIGGVWHPVSKFTKKELELQGKETLGRLQKDIDKKNVLSSSIDKTHLDMENEETIATVKKIEDRKGKKGSRTIQRKII